MQYGKSPPEILKEKKWFKKVRPRVLIVIDYENFRFLLTRLNILVSACKISKYIQKLLPGSKVIKKLFYAGVFPEVYLGRQEILDIFELAGFKLILKPVKIQKKRNGITNIKGDLDVDIAVDVMSYTFVRQPNFPKYDLLLFFGGDGDYAGLFQRIIEETPKQILVFSGPGNIGKEVGILVAEEPSRIQYLNIAEIVKDLGEYNYQRTINN